jgi:hypothetical protein
MDVDKAIRDAINGVAKKLVTVRTGTVVSNLVATDKTQVILDNDPTGAVVQALNLAGPLAKDTRVVCIAYPLRGLVVVGPLDATKSLATLTSNVATNTSNVATNTSGIATINTKIADSGWINIVPTAPFAVQDTIYVRKIGSQVFCRGGWNNTGMSASATNTSLGTVPVGYRPVVNYVFRAGTASGAGAASFFIESGTGFIQCRTNATLSAYYLWTGGNWFIN